MAEHTEEDHNKPVASTDPSKRRQAPMKRQITFKEDDTETTLHDEDEDAVSPLRETFRLEDEKHTKLFKKRRWVSADWGHSRPRVPPRRLSDPRHDRDMFAILRARKISQRMRRLSTIYFPSASPKDENPVRGTWSNQFEFFLSCLGFAVGLGNLPEKKCSWLWLTSHFLLVVCYQDGGGAFLIPFVLMTILCGLPILLLELTIGQYSSEGSVTVWKLSPVFKGLGIGMVMVSVFLAAYYNVITGWAFYYLFVSLRPVLPWTCCQQDWIDDPQSTCVSFSNDCPAQDNSSVLSNSSDSFFGPISPLINASSTTSTNTTTRLFAADFYFHRSVLDLSPKVEFFSSGIDKLGSIQVHLALSLLVAWLLVFVVLMRGIKSIGKIVYFTSLFPYVVLVILFVRAVIEDGALDGIMFYFLPKWEKLGEAKVWGDALVQVFYSTSAGTGGIITLASYNRFHNDILRDTIILGLANVLTSIFSGMVVFAILGFMARHQDTTIDNVVTRGPGLTFITYPQAVTLLPAAPFWSVMFFLMLITLALSSMFPIVESVTTAIIDEFPDTLRPFKFWVTLLTCVALYLFGLLMTNSGGMYVLQLLDKFAVGWALVIIGLFEVMVCTWRYGYKRLYDDIATMIGRRPSLFWAINWVLVCPILLVFCLIFSLVEFSPLSYGSYEFPAWSNSVGWFLAIVSFLPVPAYGSYYIYKHIKKFPNQASVHVLRQISEPALSWGPAVAANKTEAIAKRQLSNAPA